MELASKTHKRNSADNHLNQSGEPLGSKNHSSITSVGETVSTIATSFSDELDSIRSIKDACGSMYNKEGSAKIMRAASSGAIKTGVQVLGACSIPVADAVSFIPELIDSTGFITGHNYCNAQKSAKKIYHDKSTPSRLKEIAGFMHEQLRKKNNRRELSGVSSAASIASFFYPPVAAIGIGITLGVKLDAVHRRREKGKRLKENDLNILLKSEYQNAKEKLLKLKMSKNQNPDKASHKWSVPKDEEITDADIYLKMAKNKKNSNIKRHCMAWSLAESIKAENNTTGVYSLFSKNILNKEVDDELLKSLSKEEDMNGFVKEIYKAMSSNG